MAKLNIHDIEELKNVNEKRVWEMFSWYVDQSNDADLCTCSICVLDVVAITLNTIPPHYQTIGASMEDAKKKVPDAEIYRAIKRAAEKVKDAPHH